MGEEGCGSWEDEGGGGVGLRVGEGEGEEMAVTDGGW